MGLAAVLLSRWIANDIERRFEYCGILAGYLGLDIYETDKDDDDEYYGYIDTTTYFFTFMEEFYKIVDSGTLTLPEGLTLSTKYSPCNVCKNRDNVVVQNVRCKHAPDCEEHLQKLDNPEYKEKCDCRIFNSPCLSYSKIGLVLHLEFVNEDGSLLNFDVDINPPSFSVSNRRYRDKKNDIVVEEPDYDGSNKDKRAWLRRHRPVDWKSEWIKSEDMSDATRQGDGLRRAVRLRFFNNRDVLAERVDIFCNFTYI